MHDSPRVLPIVACVLILAVAPLVNAAPPKVEVQMDGGQHRLLSDGEPYFVKGAGGTTHLDLLAEVGGNSIRTWGTDNIEAVLDEAHKHGLSVCVGFWLGHERHGFDYQDEAAVVKQLEACLESVRKWKDHPAVLMWGIGNEMEGDGKNPAIWYAVDHIAKECKRLDPNHPTITVIAELGDHKVRSIERFCPNIDIIGVNSYGGVSTVAQRYRAAGGTKPYIVTEFGPRGPWEVGKTAWGAPIEATSTAKAKQYAEGYRKAIATEDGLCLGSYAFIWGHKQETTATWFGMLLPDGSRLAAVDTASEAWTGSPVKNRCPAIDSIGLERTKGLKPGETVAAQVVVSDPGQDQLAFEWVLRQDAVVIGSGGDFQPAQAALAGAVKGKGTEATLTVPAGGGAYRLFAYVRDGHGGAAVANVPFFVDAAVVPLAAPKATLPLVVYGDDAKQSPYIPSGHMGNTAAIKLTPDCTDNPHSGETCLKAQYTAADCWGGVLWQSPPNDWEGEKPGGLDLTGATEVEFWARGAQGGETVDFMLGVIEGDKPYRDSGKAELREIRLTKQWQKFRIPLDGRDLSRIKTGFGWSLAGQGKAVTFYLDDIRYVGE